MGPSVRVVRISARVGSLAITLRPQFFVTLRTINKNYEGFLGILGAGLGGFGASFALRRDWLNVLPPSSQPLAIVSARRCHPRCKILS